MKRSAVLLLIIGLAGLLIVACGGDDDDAATPSATSTPTLTASVTETPDDAGELFGGTPVDQYFATNCASCHGVDRQGIVGPALTKDVLTEADDFYFDAIADGRPGTVMPGWRDAGPLSDSEIDALVTFLKTTDP